MKTRILKLALLCMVIFAGLVPLAHAADMPTAAGSPIAGISFDDRPLILPVQRNFQMAMLTASSELSRSCGRMEAYGWRMAENEQDRVNVIFNNTVDRLRAQGYAVEARQMTTVSRDVTLFTADRTDRHLIFLWSAGEIGLVMVMCETSTPLPPISEHRMRQGELASSSAATMPSHVPMAETVRGTLSKTSEPQAPARASFDKTSEGSSFSPEGKWIGDYTCGQGTTGATLSVEKIKGDQFEGLFSFYPTSKNPYVPEGSYRVFGEYDADTQRILINPGKWIKQPKGFYNTIMIGSFDAVTKSFSGYFQGITGCTSFEAKLDAGSAPAKKADKKKAKKKVTKPAPKKAKTSAKTDKPAESVADAPPALDASALTATATPAEAPAAPAAAPAASTQPQDRASAIEPPVGILLPPVK